MSDIDKLVTECAKAAIRCVTPEKFSDAVTRSVEHALTPLARELRRLAAERGRDYACAEHANHAVAEPLCRHCARSAAVAAAYERAAKVLRESDRHRAADIVLALIPKPTPQPVPRLQEIHPPTLAGFGSKSGRMFVEAPPHTAAELPVATASTLAKLAEPFVRATRVSTFGYEMRDEPGEVGCLTPPSETELPSKSSADGRTAPPPSATRDEERERLISEMHRQHPPDATEPGSCQFEYPCVTLALLALLEADGKRIAELEREIAELTARVHADNAVCLCGCHESEHESHGEDGESCAEPNHECLRVPVAARDYAAKLRALNERMEELIREWVKADYENAFDGSIERAESGLHALLAELDAKKGKNRE